MTNPRDDKASDETHTRDARGQRRFTRDQKWAAAARVGDDAAFAQLVEAWLDPAHDRVVQFGIPADDRARILSGGFDDVRTELALGTTAPFTSLLIRSLILRTGPPQPTSPLADGDAEQRAAERLTRGTNVRAVSADPFVAALLWEAAGLLGPENRDILDLHWRHSLCPEEIAIGIEVAEDRVHVAIQKLPEGFANVVRARLLWAGGNPRNKDLAAALTAAGVTTFDAAAVRTIHAEARDSSVLRAQALIPLSPAEIFAEIPIITTPNAMRREVIAGVTAGRAALTARTSPSDAATDRAVASRTATDPDEREVFDPDDDHLSGSVSAAGLLFGGGASLGDAFAEDAFAEAAASGPGTPATPPTPSPPRPASSHADPETSPRTSATSPSPSPEGG